MSKVFYVLYCPIFGAFPETGPAGTGIVLAVGREQSGVTTHTVEMPLSLLAQMGTAKGRLSAFLPAYGKLLRT